MYFIMLIIICLIIICLINTNTYFGVLESFEILNPLANGLFSIFNWVTWKYWKCWNYWKYLLIVINNYSLSLMTNKLLVITICMSVVIFLIVLNFVFNQNKPKSEPNTNLVSRRISQNKWKYFKPWTLKLERINSQVTSN